MCWKPCQSPDLNPIENLWYDLKIAIYQEDPSNLKELEQFSFEERVKIPVARCGKVTERYNKRLLLQKVALQSSDFKEVKTCAYTTYIHYRL